MRPRYASPNARLLIESYRRDSDGKQRHVGTEERIRRLLLATNVCALKNVPRPLYGSDKRQIVSLRSRTLAERDHREGHRPRVLIIEDNLAQLDMYATVLEREVDVLKASRGEAGYAAACAERPDVIVLDLLLPDVDGFEVCRRLRATRPTADIPIIFLTGDEPSVFKAMAAHECSHVAAILQKPTPADQLLATIRAAIKESRM